MRKPEYYTEEKRSALQRELQTKLSLPPYSNVGVGQYMRLESTEIPLLYNVLKDLPQAYVDTVYDTKSAAISGDVFYGKIRDGKSRIWDSFIIARPSDYQGAPHITQDTIALSSLSAGDDALMYIHANYKGRYMPPPDYDTYRNRIAPRQIYDIPSQKTDMPDGGFLAKGFEHIRANCSKR